MTMKRKTLLIIFIIAALACMFTIFANAQAAPDTKGEVFTLADGTSLPVRDVEGNGLIWYKSTKNQDDGFANYDYVANNQFDTSITPYVTYTKATYSRSVSGTNYTGYQLNSITINDGSTTYSSTSTALVLVNLEGNLYDSSHAFTMFSKNFNGASSLEAVYLDSRVQFILSNSFQNCTSLRKINIENTSLLEVGEAAFNGCSALTSIVLPQTTKIIGHYPFQNTGLIEFTIPDSVVTVSGSAHFNGCKNLVRIYGLERLFTDKILSSIPGSMFKDCTKLQMPFEGGVFPANITEIGASAFQGCTSIGTTLILPNGLTKIGQSSFNGCTSLTKVVLGASFSTWASYDGFKNCSNLKEVYIPATMGSIAGNVFNTAASDCVFYFTGTKNQLILLKANTNSNNTAFLDAYKQAKSATEFANLETKSGRYIVYEYGVCDAFYNGIHSTGEAISFSYPSGFEKDGVLKSICSVCNADVYTATSPIISSLGYAHSTSSDRVIVSSGYMVNTELVDLYNEKNGVLLEIGILFSSSEALLLDVPTSLEGFEYASNKQQNKFSSYDFKISFPGKESPDYSKFINSEFVATSFIFDGTTYYFYQGMSTDNEVSSLESGFSTTSLSQITGDVFVEEGCTDDPNSHTYGEMAIVDGTCTTAATGTRTCTLCGYSQTIVDESVKGHIWGEWKDSAFLTIERSCLVSGCTDKQVKTFANITASVLSDATITSTAYCSNVGVAYNGDWEDTSIATRNPNDDVIITYTLSAPTQIDRIYVKGHGSAVAKFTISVIYENSDSYVVIGSGSFLTSAQNSSADRVIPYVEVSKDKRIVAAKLTISKGSYGMDYLSEFALTKLTGIGADITNETVTVTYDTDLGYFVNYFDYSKYVTTNGTISSHPIPSHKNADMEFVGWYLDPEFTVAATLNTVYSENTTLYSKWVYSSTCTSPSGEHTCEEWTVITPPTCSTKGEKSAVCKDCGKTVIASIEKAEHTPVTVEGVAPNCSTVGVSDSVKCSVCGEHISGGELLPTNDTHISNNLTIINNPTKYVVGKASGVCELCAIDFVAEIPFTATQEELSSVDVGVKYTGGKYNNEVFTNIAPLGRIYASSFFAGTLGSNVIDKDYATFWNADTYVDGADYTKDYIELELPKVYDIGVIALTLPNYPSYNLGEGCYVSYDIEYWDAEAQQWIYLGSLSDKDSSPLGANCLAKLTLDTPVSTQKIRAKVTHASRYAPAVIYELELFGKANSFDYSIENVAKKAKLTWLGRVNDWVSGGDAAVDGDLSTYWTTGIRWGDTWALLEYDEETYVACIQIAIAAHNSRIFKLEVYENGEWVQIGGNHTAVSTIGGNVISYVNGVSTFNFDIEKKITKVKFSMVSDPDIWGSNVYEIGVYAVSGAVNDPITAECLHTDLVQSRVVAPTCDSTGYTIMTCVSCGNAEFKTKATDITTHSFGAYTIATPATSSSVGTKVASCANCNATSTITYEQNYEAPVITPYLHDAPAAWAQTFDDGNYSDTYDWVIPQLQKYGFRATALLSISFAGTHTEAWNERLESGVFDIGSHSYNHAGLYHASVSYSDLLSDVVVAQYWLRSNFIGQKIITFAAPNGATSNEVANYLTNIFVANRNGGQGYAFYNVISDLENGRSTWGNLNSYISKADQTEGDYVFTNSNGSVIYTKDADGNYVLNSSYANKNINYVFDESAKTFVNKGFAAGTYIYVAEDYRYDFYETGSYNLVNGSFVFVNDNSGEYKLVKATIGSYENAINTLVSKGAFTVECLHSLGSGSIYSSYNSTISKFEYLTRLGVWAPSYQDLTLYLKEAQNAKVETISRTDDTLIINVTDNLDNYIFDHALTVKVDIDDSWTSVTVTQNGVEIKLVDIDEYRASKNMSTISCAIEDGYLYIDIIPDGGEIVITANAKISETGNGNAQIGVNISDILG